jgi:hypothetical protein
VDERGARLDVLGRVGEDAPRLPEVRVLLHVVVVEEVEEAEVAIERAAVGRVVGGERLVLLGLAADDLRGSAAAKVRREGREVDTRREDGSMKQAASPARR